MRGFLAFIGAVLLTLFVVAVVLFALANQTSPTYSLLGNTFTLSAWIPVAIAAALGILLTLLALAPMLTASGRQRGADRERAALLDRQFAEQRSANEALQARISSLEGERDGALRQRDDMVSEREMVQARAERAEAAAMAAIRNGTTDAAATDGRMVDGRMVDGRGPAPMAAPMAARTDTAVPAAARETTTETTTETTIDPAPEGGMVDERPFEVRRAQNPTLGDRLRGLFAGPDRADDANATPDNQPPATA
jgi:uncharacterized integral membrane protein